MKDLVIPYPEKSAKGAHLALKSLFARTTFFALRNAFVAAGVRILIGIVKRIGKGELRWIVLKPVLKEIFSLDPLKWGFIFGSLVCFSLLKEIIRKLGCLCRVPEKVASALAASICSLPVLVLNKETRTDLCLYVLVRALHSFAVGHILPLLPRPLREFQYYDIVVMCLSASQILYGVVFAPFSLPSSYQRFLSKASMLDNRLVRGHAGLARYQLTPELVELCMERGIKVPQSAREHFSIGCLLTHPGMTCNTFFLRFIGRNMIQVGLPLYTPLTLGKLILYQRKKLRNQPFELLQNSVRSVLSSALFLALYAASSVRFACFFAQGNIRGGFFFAIFCSMAGIATLLEPKGRRMDLSLYCFMYALRSFFMTQYRLGWIPYPRHKGICLLYVTSLGFLTYQFDQEPDKLNPRLYGYLSKLFPVMQLERGMKEKTCGSVDSMGMLDEQ
ncbi:hypothetical protein TraAM80_04526 [Trypanosoma rangeli]|uniref:Transmembrane protein 135 N-terminal domain-containing protein n=1 Tax=Trypanosoma rangeli TaxID=5698 RepID=A0A3R7MN24_TRYRA|nr:uncharacterized protein TraAM80_04526 [Trypanosoma rangeli]RNF05486.1 hypothetical protein TraAM80_04526 [Trypanosoma rangeli]|eukprot:RNF05486.1 hypothetical protein TraAM80_04526 [Trypanosoma rangeli]